MEEQRVSIGIAAAVGPEVARRIAPAIEQAGFGALWVNDTPGADALEVSAAAAAVTSRLRVATGVIAVDRRPAPQLLADLARLDIPADRLVLGIGSGAARSGALGLVRDAVDELRQGGVGDIVVGALGPRMRRLAADRADGVLLNWLTPCAAAEEASEHRASDGAGRVVLYVRTAVEDDAVPRLEHEAARYESIPSYAANFARLGLAPMDTVILPDGLPGRVERYADVVDEVVLRAVVAQDGPDDYARFVDRVSESIRETADAV
ncbi:LLM class flavin-dependent oxidoreductase [Microbacterium sp. Root53]|uniref:LLM class flavin-dependent oxidoreductase n=1 Tax=Microbacterium sp. Root53 TaxID=1736553 RepID=UPI0006F358ED|nr:LLM class flavin-dependent oxidoreductase [Microbacterium sp. Root53]KQZ05106.1 N5,N10-methylene tetrahydromethanopterin reductase [Microbacterium sp. Root53]